MARIPDLDKLIADFQSKATIDCPKRQILKDLDLIVLDNSIRESTVGQLRGHTLENKWKIYDEVKRCGFRYTVVAAFSHMTRVDDTFIQELIAEGEDPEDLFAFTEAFEHKSDLKSVPVGKLFFNFRAQNSLKNVDWTDSIFAPKIGNSTRLHTFFSAKIQKDPK